jgi:phenylalanyl-tRNA synthetase beta chain
MQGRTALAVFGALHPRIAQHADLRGAAAAFTVYLDRIPAPKKRAATRPALAASDLQPVERDFAFVVDAGVAAETLVRAARGADRALIADVTVFDVFDGALAAEQLGAGRKSVALAVRLQPTTATLTDAEIESVSARIVAAAQKAAGATLRGA